MNTVDRASLAGNLARWNEVAKRHAASDIYRVPQVLAGTANLSTLESSALGDLAGLRCLHLMCHIATDAVILSRLSESVVGVDYSLAAIAIATELAGAARRSNLDLLVGDVHALPLRAEQFDVVLLNWGSLVWIFDLDAVLAEIQRVLRPGGKVVIIDQHPVSLAHRRGGPGRAGPVPKENYFGPQRIAVERRDYTDRSAELRNPVVVEARYTMAEIIRSVRTSFMLDRFTEHPLLGWPAFRGMRRAEETLWAADEWPIPLSFVIIASV